MNFLERKKGKILISSTNRSLARNSHVSDYYITPISSITEFLSSFNEKECIDWTGINILDPCAGGDANNGMSYPLALSEFCKTKSIETIDIRNDSLANIKADYLDHNVQHKPNLIITNPPFNIALDIIKKALDDVLDNGWVIMLLRLNFFGSKQRKAFWDKFMPRYAFVHHKRIGFTQNGSTDSIEYMHCCWQKGNYPNFCELKVI